jgi:hypothetical protein
VTIDSSGNVGIGTTTPAGLLDVEAGTAAASTNGSSIFLTAQNAGSGNQNGGHIVLTPGSKTGSGIYGNVLVGYTPATAPSWLVSNGMALAGGIWANTGVSMGTGTNVGWGDSTTYINGVGASGTGSIAFSTASTERLRITGNGNVGIGTTTPAGNLAIDNAGHNATICLNGTCSTTIGGGGGSQSSASNFVLNSNSDGTGSDGGFDFQEHGASIFKVSDTGGVTTYGNITGNSALAVASGGTNQNLGLASSGTGSVNVATGGGTALSVLDSGGTTANYVSVKGATAGNAPVIATAGTDTNINLALMPKGTGNVGIGITTPSSNLSFTGQSAQTIGMERQQTAATAGNNLTISSSGAKSGASNKKGGDLIFKSGTNTGNPGAGSSSIIFQVPEWNVGAATSDAAPTNTLMTLNDGGVQINALTQGPALTAIANGGIGFAQGVAGSFQSQVNTATDGAQVVLFHGRGGPYGVPSANDTIGQVDFQAWDNPQTSLINYAEIKSYVVDATHSAAMGSLAFSTANNSVSTERMRIDNNGRVGIGTTAPTAPLQVGNGGPSAENPTLLLSNGGGTGLHMVDSVNSVELEFDTWSGGAYIGSLTNGPVQIVTNDQAGIYLDTNKWVAMGKGTGVIPTEALDVNGALRFGNTVSSHAGTMRFTGTNFQAYDGSSWFNFVPNPPAASACDQTITLNGTGVNSYTVPASYATITIKVWGGGGSGGGYCLSNDPSGGSSSISSLGLNAGGGGSGGGGCSTNGGGALGGNAVGGDINTSGNAGTVGTNTQSGTGGSAPAGGAGGIGATFWAFGANGSQPGGGGAGGSTTVNGNYGGGGSGGFVQKTFTPATLPVNTSITDIIVGAGTVATSSYPSGGNGGNGQVTITCSTTGAPPVNNNGILYLNSGAYSSSSTFVYSSGNVGVGTTTPQTTLDVNGTARLAKNSSQPYVCDATHDGAIALTHVYTLCICNGGSTSWVQSKDGATACSW